MTTNDYNHQHHAAIEQKKGPRDVILDVSWAFSNFYLFICFSIVVRIVKIKN